MIITDLFLYFIAYSFIGWVYESIFCSISAKKLINRGFLTGPLIPIYGVGALLVVLVFYSKNYSWYFIFFASIILTSTLEYITSYLLEKIFQAHWWNYSKYPFNLNGRIYLLGSVFFGLISVLAIKVVHPIFDSFVNKIPYETKLILMFVLSVYFITDLSVTFIQLLGLKNRVIEISEAFNRFKESSEKKFNGIKNEIIDKFEESEYFNDRIKGMMEKGQYQIKRISKAFPSFEYDKHQELWLRIKNRALKNRKPK